MAMVVKNNMSAISTLNTLNRNSSALSKSLQKVSSGMRINGAADDASGYAISERMRVQIRSLDQANRNTQNGNSMMKTAEGAVASTVEILKTLKEKVINAANDTNTDADRQTIQKEMNQSIDQIDDNANITYNGKLLVDGSKNTLGQATNTSMTNQALLAGTTGDTRLVDLQARNGDKLNIQTTDKIAISYVKEGKTYTAHMNVTSDTKLKDIFQAAEDVNEDDQIFANKANVAYQKALNGNTDATDSTVSTALSNAISDVTSATTAFSTAKSDIISAAAVLSTSVSDWNSTVADAASLAVPADQTAVRNAGALNVNASDYNLNTAKGAADYIAAVTGASNYASVATLASSATLPNTVNTNSAATSTAASNYTSSYSDYVAQTGVVMLSGANVGVATSNDMVKTADETPALTVMANQFGNEPQIAGLCINVTDSEGNVKKSVNSALDSFTESVRAQNASADNAITLQIGAKANQSIKVGLTDMRSVALGLKGADGTKLNISTQEYANAAVNVLDSALQKALDQQTTIGSVQSRLDYTSSNLTAGSENVQASESAIRDADMAKEMTEYTKNNVLLQAAQSMLSQANQNSSAVLSLLQ